MAKIMTNQNAGIINCFQTINVTILACFKTHYFNVMLAAGIKPFILTKSLFGANTESLMNHLKTLFIN